MPEMTMLGWFHTILGIGAVSTGFYAIAKFKIISSLMKKIFVKEEIVSANFCRKEKCFRNVKLFFF